MTTIIALDNIQTYIVLAITGFFTGLGASLGTWITQILIIRRSERLAEHLRKKRLKKK